MTRFYIQKIKMQPVADGSYLCDLPVVQYLNKTLALDFAQPVTFLVGENGTGKSTLLEAIAVRAGFNSEGGSTNFRFSTRQTTSHLADFMNIVKTNYEQDGFFLRAESFYNVATQVDELQLNVMNYGGTSL